MGDVEREPVAMISQEDVERAIDEEVVSWDLLLSLSGMTVSERAGEEGRAFGQRMVVPAETIYREKCGGDVALYPPVGGVNFHANGDFNWTIQTDAILFDWSSAWPLTYEIELLADEAREWWPEEATINGKAVLARASRFFRTAIGSAGAAENRRSHMLRAFALAAWVMQSLQQEDFRQPADAAEDLPKPGAIFEAEVENYRNELDSIQGRFQDAIQRRVQSRYWQGAIVGMAVVALISIVVGLIFWWKGTSAAYGVAIPAGGLGAMVSLLQRMSSGRFVLDVNASRDLLELFGAVRPLIGAVFGLAITALFAGGLIPAVTIPAGQELAFYAGVGFLAGFNERWAQDMLKSSSNQVAH